MVEKKSNETAPDSTCWAKSLSVYVAVHCFQHLRYCRYYTETSPLVVWFVGNTKTEDRGIGAGAIFCLLCDKTRSDAAPILGHPRFQGSLPNVPFEVPTNVSCHLLRRVLMDFLQR